MIDYSEHVLCRFFIRLRDIIKLVEMMCAMKKSLNFLLKKTLLGIDFLCLNGVCLHLVPGC